MLLSCPIVLAGTLADQSEQDNIDDIEPDAHLRQSDTS